MKAMTAVGFTLVAFMGGGWHPSEAKDSRAGTIVIAAEAVSKNKKSDAGRPEAGKILLDWAKANQVFQPWFAWAYAVEARLTKDPRDRQRAIALAHYLDANSDRLSAVPRQEINAAVTAFANQNPFRPVGTTGKGKRL